MAQGQAVTAAPLALNKSDDASANDWKALEQYEKIIQLRDAVLSGQHPTIKLPPGVLASKWSPSGSREASRPGSARQSNMISLSTPDASASRNQPSTASRDIPSEPSYAARTADINPLFLQKSDELIRAEFRVQRRRLEQGLAEECAQHRSMADAQEMYSDAELSMFLLKALNLNQPALPTPADAPAIEGAAASANEAASDSFDDDTFYSSKHPTPESTLTSRVRRDSAEATRQDVTAEQTNRYHPPAAVPTNNEIRVLGQGQPAQSSTQATPLHSFHVQPTSVSHEAAAPAPTPFQVPGLNNYIERPSHAQGAQTPADSAPSGSAPSLVAHGQPYKNAQEHLDDIYMEHHPPSPLVRTLDAGPAATRSAPTHSHTGQAPSASHVHPLANLPQVAPAQVAALRNEPVSVDSPESSPQSGKEKKKAKKKKRKAERQAPEDVMPQIKPEPRSPSPINAPTYIRPKKRQRQATRSGNNSDQEEVMITASLQPAPDGRYYEPAPYDYGASNGYSQRAASATIMPAPRFEGAYPTDPVYVHQPPARYVERPPPPPYARPPSLVHIDNGYREPQPVHREQYETSRMSVRPDAYPYMGQPMPPPPPQPPQRVFIDSSGREYLEPSRPPARQSVAPPPSGRELVYEQPPPRAVSRYPGHATHEDQRDAAYTGYPAPRRVVTQPEYVSRGYAEPPPREYSLRPAGQPQEYVQVIQPGSHYGGEPPRDYGTRTGSARPAEPVRYEYGRMQSARTEPSRLEGNQDAYRVNSDAYRVEYVAQPPEASNQYRGYSMRPSDQQYYEQPHARQGGEVAYIERPAGGPPGMVYR